MTASAAKSVHEFFNEENPFFETFDKETDQSIPSTVFPTEGNFNTTDDLTYSPLSVDSVSLSPSNETPSPNNFTLPEKRKVSSPDSDIDESDSRKNSNGSEFGGDSEYGTPVPSAKSKAVKSDAGSTVSSSKAAAAAAAKKAGRKPEQNEPENKRKAQNRAAQRAFRERKEKHLKDLEDRVLQLENEAATNSNENNFLRLQVERLQDELRKYRQVSKGSSLSNDSGSASKNTILLKQELGGSAATVSSAAKPFTFEFPFFSNADGTKPASLTNGMHTINTGSIGKTSVLGSIDGSSTRRSTNIESPFGSISSASPNSVSSSSSPATTVDPLRRSSSLTEPKPEEFCDQLSLACGTKDHPVPKANNSSLSVKGSPVVITAGSIPWTSSASPQAISNFNSGVGSVASSTSARTPSSSSAFGGVFSPSEFDTGFISGYRDPLFDGEQFTMPELTTSEYSIFDPIENPIANTAFEMLNKNAVLEKRDEVPSKVDPVVVPVDDDSETVPAYPNKLMNCTAVWDRICQHPKFGDIDIDGLCHELRSKAKCSETGVLLTEKDVDKVLDSFSDRR